MALLSHNLADILILWDIDGTILSAKGAGPDAFEKATEDQYGKVIPLSSINWLGATDFAIAYGLLEKLGQKVNRRNAEKLVDGYLSNLPGLLDDTQAKANPGIPKLLETLHQHPRVHQALLTGNVKRGSDIKLDYIGVNHYFMFGAFADHSEHRNELGRLALELARRYLNPNWSADHIYVIGDTPKDIECGKVIGAHTVAVATGHHSVEELKPHEPSVVFENFADPSGLLKFLDL